MDDAAKAAKRAEIEAKVAAMKAEQKKQEVSALKAMGVVLPHTES